MLAFKTWWRLGQEPEESVALWTEAPIPSKPTPQPWLEEVVVLPMWDWLQEPTILLAKNGGFSCE